MAVQCKPTKTAYDAATKHNLEQYEISELADAIELKLDPGESLTISRPEIKKYPVLFVGTDGKPYITPAKFESVADYDEIYHKVTVTARPESICLLSPENLKYISDSLFGEL